MGAMPDAMPNDGLGRRDSEGNRKFPKDVARPKGLEPLTHGLEGEIHVRQVPRIQ
jgi:hypothetical protein